MTWLLGPGRGVDHVDEHDQTVRESVRSGVLEAGLNGNTYVLITPDPETKDQLLANKLLRNSPAVTEGHVYAMDPDSFRLDYYSATNMLGALADQLG